MPDSSQEQQFGNVDLTNSKLASTNAGRDAIVDSQVTIHRSFIAVHGDRSVSPGIDWDWAMQILKQQQPDIKKRLKDSLFGLADVDTVEMESRRQEESPALALEAKKTLTVNGTDAGTIDPQAPIIATYAREDIDGSLLILGTPGAGKTITLLKLAEQLVGEAIAQPQKVIPIIFELSTWRDGQEIEAWLIEQLYENYGGNRKRKIYEMWVERRVLLPLLDGLDELGMVRQKACTEKVNAFAKIYPQVVVCCRVKEFQQAGVNLSNLRGKVQLQPLSDQQIERYLQQMGKIGLWEQIQMVQEMRRLLEPVIDKENPDYDEPGLLRVPLFISLAAQVYEQDKLLKGKKDLFDRYIDRQLSFDVRVGDRDRKELKKRDWAFKTVEEETGWQHTKEVLSIISKKLNFGGQVQLLIEELQPWFLVDEEDENTCEFINGIIYAAIYTVSVSFIIGSLYDKVYALPIGFIGGLLVFKFRSLYQIRTFGISQVDIYQKTWRGFLRLIIPLISLVVLFVGYLFLVFALISLFNLPDLFKASISVGLMFLTIFLDYNFYSRLGSSFVESMFASVFTSINEPFKENQDVISRLLGLTKQTHIKICFKPNQGILDSWQSCKIIAFLSYPAGVIWSMSMAALPHIKPSNYLENISLSSNIRQIIREGDWRGFWTYMGEPSSTRGLWVSPINLSIVEWVISSTVCALVLGFLLGGGVACIQHLILRIFLTHHHKIPWNLAQFLTYCHERRLLQQIGGRYRFIHRELLEHFARIEN